MLYIKKLIEKIGMSVRINDELRDSFIEKKEELDRLIAMQKAVEAEKLTYEQESEPSAPELSPSRRSKQSQK